MTTDDMREIEAALDNLIEHERDRALDGIGKTKAMREWFLDLIRQKLPQADAEHERAVELTNDEREAMKEPGVYAIDGRIVGVVDATATPIGRMVRMSARPVADKAAGELLRAAKDVLHNFHVDMDQEHRSGFYGPQDVDAMIAMDDAIQAAERAGFR